MPPPPRCPPTLSQSMWPGSSRPCAQLGAVLTDRATCPLDAWASTRTASPSHGAPTIFSGGIGLPGAWTLRHASLSGTEGGSRRVPKRLHGSRLRVGDSPRPYRKWIDPSDTGPSAPGRDQPPQSSIGQDNGLADEAAPTMPDPPGPPPRGDPLGSRPETPQSRSCQAGFSLS